MRRVLKRAVPALAAAVMWAGAGSALLASPAAATGGLTDEGLWGQVTNLTPYAWELVGATGDQWGTACWGQGNPGFRQGGNNAPFPQTVEPGQSFVYMLQVCWTEGGGILGPGYEQRHINGFLTYKADTEGHDEYLTLRIWGAWGRDSWPSVEIYNTTEAPPPNWDPSVSPPPVPVTPGSPTDTSGQPSTIEITWAQWTFPPNNGADMAFMPHSGHYTVDAATDPPALVRLLNAMCDNSKSTKCDFEAYGPLEWGVGDPVAQGKAYNCVGTTDPRESKTEPNYFYLSYDTSKEAEFSVGGGLTLSTGFNIADIIKGEASIGITASHSWGVTESTKREAYVFIPDNNVLEVWAAPSQAQIKGTLTLDFGGAYNSGAATWTVLNFAQKQSGIARPSSGSYIAGEVNGAPLTVWDPGVPDWDLVSRARPMTPDELRNVCHQRGGAAAARATAAVQARPARRPAASKPAATATASLFPGRGVARVRLGQTKAQVAEQMGKPLLESVATVDCPLLDLRCDAPRPRVTSVYPRVSASFGADRRVHTIIYRGSAKTAEGTGVGTRLAPFQRAHSGERCVQYISHTNCTLKRRQGGKTVKAVFHFTHGARGIRRCDRVMIHNSTGNRRGVTS